MDKDQKIKLVQNKSKELGRCVCSMKHRPFICPCKFFIDKKICHCSGEYHEESIQEWMDYNLT